MALPLFGGLVVIGTHALFLQRGQRFSRVYRPVPSVTGSPGLRPHARSSEAPRCSSHTGFLVAAH